MPLLTAKITITALIWFIWVIYTKSMLTDANKFKGRNKKILISIALILSVTAGVFTYAATALIWSP